MPVDRQAERSKRTHRSGGIAGRRNEATAIRDRKSRRRNYTARFHGEHSMTQQSTSAPPTKPAGGSDAVRKHREYLFPAVTMFYKEPIALTRGEGAYVWDDQGNRYLDC